MIKRSFVLQFEQIRSSSKNDKIIANKYKRDSSFDSL